MDPCDHGKDPRYKIDHAKGVKCYMVETSVDYVDDKVQDERDSDGELLTSQTLMFSSCYEQSDPCSVNVSVQIEIVSEEVANKT